jgi:hypothetical protein
MQISKHRFAKGFAKKVKLLSGFMVNFRNPAHRRHGKKYLQDIGIVFAM